MNSISTHNERDGVKIEFENIKPFIIVEIMGYVGINVTHLAYYLYAKIKIFW